VILQHHLRLHVHPRLRSIFPAANLLGHEKSPIRGIEPRSDHPHPAHGENMYWGFSFKSTVTYHAPPVDHKFWSQSRITRASVKPPNTSKLLENCKKSEIFGENIEIFEYVMQKFGCCQNVE
jgi:hypothetical protein